MLHINSYIYKIIFLLGIITVTLTACEKDITVDFPQPESKIVVEGHIEQGYPPFVILSRNAPYFAAFDAASLKNYTIKGATVTVNDGSQTFTLTEIDTMGLSLYTSFLLRGQIGKTYKLSVTKDGKSVSAVTYIPKPIKLDSVKFEVTGTLDSLGTLKCHLTDPDTLGNYYRYMTERLHKDSPYFLINIATTFSSVFDDRLVNGKSFNFNLERGRSNTDKSADGSDAGYFKKGDTIVLRWSTISKPEFQFWQSAERNVESTGNPFASPVNVKSNIVGGLGTWGGYGASYDTVVAK
jgi:hypothetical protein